MSTVLYSSLGAGQKCRELIIQQKPSTYDGREDADKYASTPTRWWVHLEVCSAVSQGPQEGLSPSGRQQ